MALLSLSLQLFLELGICQWWNCLFESLVWLSFFTQFSEILSLDWFLDICITKMGLK